MKKAILVIFVFLYATACFGQVCKNSNKETKRAKKHFEDKNIIRATKAKLAFSKFSQGATINFVKTDNGYFLGLTLAREFGTRVDIMDDNPLVIQFEDDSILELYPDRSVPGKFTLPVTTEVNRPYYSVSPEQLELFATLSFYHVKVYLTSDKINADNVGEDDLGTFLDYEINSENRQANFIEGANCILQ